MTNSLLNSLLTDLDTQSVSRIAGALGEPEQSVLRGVKGSIAALLGALARKSEEPRILDKVMDLAPAASEDVTWSKLASGVTDSNSPLIATGKRILSGLFGASESAVTEAVGKDEPVTETPGPPSETAHQASLRLDAQFPWLAAAFARRPTRRCRPDGTRGHLLASSRHSPPRPAKANRDIGLGSINLSPMS